MKATVLKAPPSRFTLLEKLEAYYHCFGRCLPGVRPAQPAALAAPVRRGARKLVIGGKVLMIQTRGRH